MMEDDLRSWIGLTTRDQYQDALEIVAEGYRVYEARQVARRGGWKCLASGNLQGIGGIVPPSARVTGEGYGNTENEACDAAKRAATQKAPRNTYARHIQCKCERI